LTLLADKGAVFAVMMRKRWFTRRHSKAFSPIKDVEFFHDSWLEDLGREFVSMTQFSGIADFDLKVEFESRSVWFLESDPRMIGGLQSTLLFGLNIPWLLVEQMHGHLSSDSCVRPDTGYFLSPRSVPEWILRAAWREPRYGPIRSNWGFFTKDPITTIYKLLSPP